MPKFKTLAQKKYVVARIYYIFAWQEKKWIIDYDIIGLFRIMYIRIGIKISENLSA